MITVFVSGAGGGLGQGIIKSLKLIKDLNIRIITADMEAFSAGLYTADRCYLVPKASDDSYISFLTEIFKKESVDFYFPGTDVELLSCALNADHIRASSGTTVVVSPSNAIEVAEDKYLTYKFIEQNNLPVPLSYLPSNLPECLKFPVIVKPRIGCRSIGVSVANNASEMQDRLDNEPGLMIQELIGTEGDEYTCTVASAKGQFSKAFVLRRVLRAGDTFQAFPVESKTISEYVERLAHLLKINGGCNFQLRLDSNGEPKVFEINCRFSGTTPFWAQLGFNPVEYYLKATLGLPYHSSVNFDAIVLRHWTESIVETEQFEALRKQGFLDSRPPKTSKL